MPQHRISQILALCAEYVPTFLAGGGSVAAFDRRDGSVSPGAVVSVIPIVGPLRDKSAWGPSMSGIREALARAMNDPNVKAIVLDVDSPGGTVMGTQETVLAVREAAKVKPVIASVSGMAASAAYWIASNATKVFASPSSRVGSIGVILAHTEFAVMDEMMGLKTTLISAGEFKDEGNPFEALTEEAEAEFQRQVDASHGLFLKDVAKGRGVTATHVAANFGRGRMIDAPAAVKLGMIDGIAPLEQIIAGQVKANAPRARRRASAFDW